MSDYIKREDAITAFANYLGATSKTAALAAECILKPIPASPVRKGRYDVGGGRRHMRLVLQPEGSSLCGQACVAMLADITLDQSITIFKRRGATTPKEVVSALHALGIKCGDKLLLARNHEMPPICMAKLHFAWDTAHTHWTVYNNGTFYDPAIGIVKEYPEGVRLTSFLPIFMEAPNMGQGECQ